MQHSRQEAMKDGNAQPAACLTAHSHDDAPHVSLYRRCLCIHVVGCHARTRTRSERCRTKRNHLGQHPTTRATTRTHRQQDVDMNEADDDVDEEVSAEVSDFRSKPSKLVECKDFHDDENRFLV